MANHKKPTKEELKAAQEAALEADPEKDKVEDPEPETPDPEPEDDTENPEDDTSEDDVDQDNTDDSESEDENEDESEDQDEDKEPEDDEQAEPSKEMYKRKFSASSRENQRIAAKNRVINAAIVEADDIPAPTDEEMQKLYGDDWDVATEIEKESLRETQISKKWRAKIKEASDQATKIEKWNDSVEEYADDPKTLLDNPDLEGKVDEFKTFAMQEGNNSVPFPLLVNAFLFEKGVNRKYNKGAMFERGKGGSKAKPERKDGMISLEEAKILRETDYPKYREMVKAKKIRRDL